MPPISRQLIIAPDIAATAVDQITAVSPRTIALAGGSTPRPVYERLATRDLAWTEIDVFFGDERCVAPDHPDSNFHMAQETLLAKVATRVHPMPGQTCDPEAYELELKKVFGRRLPRFDLVILGLDADGHTASLFPGDAALRVEDRRVARVSRPDHSRLTLTLPVLSAAKLALFLVAGAEKREALRRLLAGDERTPAALVRAERVVVIADQPAAASQA